MRGGWCLILVVKEVLIREMTFDQCYGLNVSPQHLYAEILIFKVIVLRGVAFGGD